MPLEFGYQRKRILLTDPCYLYDHDHGHYNDHADDVSTDTHANAIAMIDASPFNLVFL